MKFLISIIIAVFLFTFFPGKTEAFSKSSAVLASAIEERTADNRVEQLKSYLERYNSPLADSAQTFVDYADRYRLDWRLIAAISGLESGFGKNIPKNSYNAWGWGVYGGKVKYFTSWDDAIATISQGLREKYMDRWGAQNIYQIGAIYAASPTWAQRVGNYMARIENFSTVDSLDTLSITL